MNYVEVVFSRAPRLDSLILRTGMWSSWSHEALLLGDQPGMIVDATFRHGVAVRPYTELLLATSKREMKRIACPDPAKAYAFARSQIGKPYDTLGVIGIGLRRDWQADDGWFCSEFVEACLSAGGNQRFVNQVHRVTTQHSWMVR